MGKIDVIIPLYNDESNIGRCLESICRQTIVEKIRIIIIDDGSIDNSVQVAKDTLKQQGMLEQSDFIRLPENQGVANARREGALAAESEYVLYCDSDDFMEPQMCETLLFKAEKDGCDVVVCDYNSIRGEDGVEVVTECYKDNYLQQLILCTVTGALWNKLIKTYILHSLDFRFPARDFSEDYVYSLQIAIRAKKIGYVPEPLYNYVHRAGSQVQAQSSEKRRKRYEDDIANFALDLDILEAEGLLEKYREEIIAHKLKVKNTYREDRELWKRTYPELGKEIFHSSYVSWRSRISFLIRNLL